MVRADRLMDPLRVALGASEPAREAARRLRAHGAIAAPVVRRGTPAGILPRVVAETALRHGVGHLACGLLVSGGAPRVGRLSGRSTIRRASRGVAPALLVTASRGIIEGIILKSRLEAAHRIPVRDLGNALEQQLGAAQRETLDRARRIAGRRGDGLCLAGGLVRDLLLGRPPADIDLVVEGDGIALAGELAAAMGGRLIRHGRFGTSVVTRGGPDPVRIDVATARREVYDRPGALPRVEAGTWLEDLLRRDLTINSMAIRLAPGPPGGLLDPLDGAGDLRRGILRVHHRLSLVEDPTRALRVARLAARFGFAPAAATLDALKLAEDRGAFLAVGGARLRHEMDLLAIEPDPAAALSWCERLDLLRWLGPGLRFDVEAGGHVARLIREIRVGSLRGDGMSSRAGLLILMILSLRARPADRALLARRLGITGEPAHRLVSSGATMASLRRALPGGRRPSRVERVCARASFETLALALATGPERLSDSVRWYLDDLRHRRSPIDGARLRALGLSPGPAVGDVLRRLRDAMLDERASGKIDLERLARRLVSRRQGGSTSGR